jgi:MFS superfamily sulfate permease-like transporter
VVILGSVDRLGGGAAGYYGTLAAIVIAGVILFILGRLKAGELGEFFPLSVVHGMLAAIGIIIMSKQFHVMLGVKPVAKEPLGLLAEIPKSLMSMNPEIAFIGIVSLLILIAHALIKNKKIKAIPIPLVVVAIAIFMGLHFDFEHIHHYFYSGKDYVVDPAKCLVLLPASFLQALTFPDFSQIASGAFWFSVISITLIQGVETLLSAAAVDKLDVYKRMSKDVGAVGLGTALSGAIGGLPMIAEIVRSTANVAAGAKTRWSNFFHGAFMLAFVVFAASIIDMIPLAALAAILVVTGFRLASPKSFKETYALGPEQLVFFVVTIIATLATDLLIGVTTGIVAKFIMQLIAGVPPSVLFKVDATVTNKEDETIAVVKKAAVFSNYISLKKILNAIPKGKYIVLDLRDCVLVDHSVMERLHQYEIDYEQAGGQFEVCGLEKHRPSSLHPLAARKLIRS